jgi:hypothetical protein
MRQVRPAAVAFVFTGNPGLDGPKGGCVDANSPDSLSQLLASYEPPLVDMANRAVRTGATVYFEAPALAAGLSYCRRAMRCGEV